MTTLNASVYKLLVDEDHSADDRYLRVHIGADLALWYDPAARTVAAANVSAITATVTDYDDADERRQKLKFASLADLEAVHAALGRAITEARGLAFTPAADDSDDTAG